IRGDRSDPTVLGALWGVDAGVAETLDGLAKRHDFVLSSSRRLHQQVRDAFRGYLLDAVRRNEMKAANQRAASVALERASSLLPGNRCSAGSPRCVRSEAFSTRGWNDDVAVTCQVDPLDHSQWLETK